MELDFDSMQKMGTWKHMILPEGRNAIGCNWVYREKYKANGSKDKRKAKLVANGSNVVSIRQS